MRDECSSGNNINNNNNYSESFHNLSLSRKDLDNFLKDTNVELTNANTNQIYENFLLFQKFMNYMLTTPPTEKSPQHGNDNNNHHQSNNTSVIKNNSNSNGVEISKQQQQQRPTKLNFIQMTGRNLCEFNSNKTTDREYDKNVHKTIKKNKHNSISGSGSCNNKVKYTSKPKYINNNHNNNKPKYAISSSSSEQKPHLSKSTTQKIAKSTTTVGFTNNSANININTSITSNTNNINCSFSVRNNNNNPNHTSINNNIIIESTNNYPLTYKPKLHHGKPVQTCKISLNKNAQFFKKRSKLNKSGNNTISTNTNNIYSKKNVNFTECLINCSTSSIEDNSISKQTITMLKQRNNSTEYSHPLNHMLTDKDSIKVDDNKPQQSEDLKEQFEKELQVLEQEKEEVAKLKCEYFSLKHKLNHDIEEFNKIKDSEFKKFEKWKNEENKKTRCNNNNNSNSNNKWTLSLRSQEEIEIIEELKMKLSQTKEEIKQKENINRMNIEQLKKQISEANKEIMQLMKITNHNNNNNNSNSNNIISHKTLPVQLTSERNINQIKSITKHSNNNIKPKNNKHKMLFKQNFTKRTHSNNTNTNNNDSNNSTLRSLNQLKTDLNNNTIPKSKHKQQQQHTYTKSTTSFNFEIPSKYILPFDLSLKKEISDDNKTIKIYSNDIKEITFKSGVKKQIFPDNYSIIYFNNNDIKQTFPDGHSVYFYSKLNTVQTTFPDNLNVFKFSNGQIEKHYPNGNKEVIYPNGTHVDVDVDVDVVMKDATSNNNDVDCVECVDLNLNEDDLYEDNINKLTICD